MKDAKDSISQIGRGVLTSGMVSGNIGVNAEGDAAAKIRSQMNAAVSGITNYDDFAKYQTLAQADLTQVGNQKALQDWFTSHGVQIDPNTPLFKDMGDAATNQATAALNMTQSSEVFKAAVGTLVNGLALYFTSKVPLTQGGIMDTHTPRGDTSSSLSSTMSAHNAISGSLTGKRMVTSSYRNFALGSINSDHVTGKALDVVGQNLGQYQTGVRSGGGFAEFHGVGDTRHLHVVPNPNPIGDSTVAAAIMTRPVSGSSGSPTYNINISGGASSAEEIANVVLYKIKQIQRSDRERA
jgi:CheY-specific phosphatase CheX